MHLLSNINNTFMNNEFFFSHNLNNKNLRRIYNLITLNLILASTGKIWRKIKIKGLSLPRRSKMTIHQAHVQQHSQTRNRHCTFQSLAQKLRMKSARINTSVGTSLTWSSSSSSTASRACQWACSWSPFPFFSSSIWPTRKSASSWWQPCLIASSSSGRQWLRFITCHCSGRGRAGLCRCNWSAAVFSFTYMDRLSSFWRIKRCTFCQASWSSTPLSSRAKMSQSTAGLWRCFTHRTQHMPLLASLWASGREWDSQLPSS